MEKINERIREICLSRYGTISNAAKSTNMNVNVLRSIVGAEKRIDTPQEPKVSHIIKILESTKCSVSWLLYGLGEMYDTDDKSLAYMHDCARVDYNNSTRSAEDANRVQSLEEQIINLQNQVSTLVATNSILTAALAEARK